MTLFDNGVPDMDSKLAPEPSEIFDNGIDAIMHTAVSHSVTVEQADMFTHTVQDELGYFDHNQN